MLAAACTEQPLRTLHGMAFPRDTPPRSCSQPPGFQNAPGRAARPREASPSSGSWYRSMAGTFPPAPSAHGSHVLEKRWFSPGPHGSPGRSSSPSVPAGWQTMLRDNRGFAADQLLAQSPGKGSQEPRRQARPRTGGRSSSEGPAAPRPVQAHSRAGDSGHSSGAVSCLPWRGRSPDGSRTPGRGPCPAWRGRGLRADDAAPPPPRQPPGLGNGPRNGPPTPALARGDERTGGDGAGGRPRALHCETAGSPGSARPPATPPTPQAGLTCPGTRPPSRAPGGPASSTGAPGPAPRPQLGSPAPPRPGTRRKPRHRRQQGPPGDGPDVASPAGGGAGRKRGGRALPARKRRLGAPAARGGAAPPRAAGPGRLTPPPPGHGARRRAPAAAPQREGGRGRDWRGLGWGPGGGGSGRLGWWGPGRCGEGGRVGGGPGVSVCQCRLSSSCGTSCWSTTG